MEPEVAGGERVAGGQGMASRGEAAVLGKVAPSTRMAVEEREEEAKAGDCLAVEEREEEAKAGDCPAVDRTLPAACKPPVTIELLEEAKARVFQPAAKA